MAIQHLQWDGTRCLVIGGAGNLGQYLVQLLHARGAVVSTLDLVPYRGDEAEVVSFTGDLCDRGVMEQAMRGVNVVFHVASVIDIRPVVSPEMRRVNVNGTQNVIECCKECNVGILIYTSSMEAVAGVNANRESVKLMDVDHDDIAVPVRHHLPYGATKAEAEQLVIAANSPELRTCALRSGYIVGPGCIGLKIGIGLAVNTPFNYYMIPEFKSSMSCVDVRNCALAHVLAAERAESPSVNGQAFFIRDFEANLPTMILHAIDGTTLKPLMLNHRLMSFLIWLVDCLCVFVVSMCAMFGIMVELPSCMFSHGAYLMGEDYMTFTGRGAREALGYGSTEYPLIPEEESLRQMSTWVKTYWTQLHGSTRSTDATKLQNGHAKVQKRWAQRLNALRTCRTDKLRTSKLRIFASAFSTYPRH